MAMRTCRDHAERKRRIETSVKCWITQRGTLQNSCFRELFTIKIITTRTQKFRIIPDSPKKFVKIIIILNRCKREREPRNRPRRTHRASGGIAQLFLNLGTRRGCVLSLN